MTYPSGLGVDYVYNARGYLTQVANLASSTVYWTANARDAELRVITETTQNLVTTARGYDAATGRLETVQAGIAGLDSAVACPSLGLGAFGARECPPDIRASLTADRASPPSLSIRSAI